MATRGRKPGKSVTPKDESKAEKFIRLAQKRTGKVLNSLRQVGQLSGAGYESTDAQVAKIFGAISDAAQAAFQKFKNKGAKEKAAGFTL
jgi:hypothetical protein